MRHQVGIEGDGQTRQPAHTLPPWPPQVPSRASLRLRSRTCPTGTWARRYERPPSTLTCGAAPSDGDPLTHASQCDGYDAASDSVDGVPIRLPLNVLGRARAAAMRGKMQLAVRDTAHRYAIAAAGAGGTGDRVGQFGLFGVDFLFDEARGCWMLEWNAGPGVRWNVLFLRKLHRHMLEDVVWLTMAPERFREERPRSKWIEVYRTPSSLPQS